MRSALTAALLVLVGACASHQPQAQLPSLDRAAADYFAASKLGDVTTSEQLLAAEHLFIGPTGKIQDKSQRVAWLLENAKWLPSVETRDVVVRDFGHTGLVTGIWVIPDSGKTVYERFSHVWILRDNRWQMIAHQVTEMPSPQAPIELE